MFGIGGLETRFTLRALACWGQCRFADLIISLYLTVAAAVNTIRPFRQELLIANGTGL